MKTYSIIISLALIACLIVIFWPQSPDQETNDLLNQRDSALLQATRKQAAYDLLNITLKHKEAELSVSRAVVKRSEENLIRAKANEKRVLRLVKEQTRLMSDLQADSVILKHYQQDTDSIAQKIVYDLSRLDYCDSVRVSSDSLIHNLQQNQYLLASKSDLQDSLLSVSRGQVSNLYSALEKDNVIISNQDKTIKKQRKKVKILGVSIPIAFLAGLLIAL